MSIEVMAKVDRDLSVDPSYIIRYQVFEENQFLGDGVIQYHRLAEQNDIALPDTLRDKEGHPLSEDARKKITQSIYQAASSFIAERN